MIKRMEKPFGRPPKPPEERKSAELRIRLTEAQRKALDEAAGGGNTSTWARKLLLKAAQRLAKAE